jgi:hypothetical protein
VLPKGIIELFDDLEKWPTLVSQDRVFAARLDFVSKWYGIFPDDRMAIAAEFCKRASAITYARSLALAEIMATTTLSINWSGKTPGRQRNGYYELRESVSIVVSSFNDKSPILGSAIISKKFPINHPNRVFDEDEFDVLTGDRSDINGWLALEKLNHGQLSVEKNPRDRWRRTFRFQSVAPPNGIII